MGFIGFTKKYWKKIFLVFVLLGFFVLLSAPLIYYKYKGEIYLSIDDMPHYPVVIVFGAAVTSNGGVSDVLADRLETAAELYKAGVVDKIIVSGDNRFENYNEPEAMYEYLKRVFGIDGNDISRDYAGRRTYDTCARAKEIWGVESAVLVTQGYHLPRALFTCNALGIDSVGYSASKQEYARGALYEVREIVAIYKAVMDVYFWTPDYILGEPESL